MSNKKQFYAIIGIVLLVQLQLQCHKPTFDRTGLEEPLFSAVWITDTQFYSEEFVSTLDSVVEWVNNSSVDFVINTGDLVNVWWNNTQWETFDQSWSRLNVPAYLLAGNHDNDEGYNFTNYNQNFPNMEYYSITQKNWLLVFISYFSIRNVTCQNWLKNTLDSYPNHNAIVCMHYYLNLDTNGEPKRNQSGNWDAWNLNAILKDYDRNFIILCGHEANCEKRLYHTVECGNFTGESIAVLHNFQAHTNGGQGYFVLISFYKNGVYMKLYSSIEHYDGNNKGYPYEFSIVVNTKSESDNDLLIVSQIILIIVVLSSIALIMNKRIVKRET